jgi:aminoglycoside phosphotransferase (APT) family kinase protein
MIRSLEFPAHDVDPARLLAALRELSGCVELELASAPERLAFGGEAVIDVLELRSPPPCLAGPLVLRRIVRPDHPRQVQREVALHRALADQGFPVPRVLLFDALGERLGAPFLVMERLAGGMPLVEVMEPSRLLRRPLRLPAVAAEALWRVPALLGGLQARLHTLDPSGIRNALREQGLDPREIGFGARLDALEEQAGRADLSGLAPGFAWLRRARKPGGRQVVCHGDLVFTNVQVESGRLTGVLDWSHASLAEPEYDVAATLNRLESRVPNVPTPLAAIFRAVQKRMRSSYLEAYRRSHAIDPAALRLYGAFWLLQELVGSGERLRAGAKPSGHITDRWLHSDVIRAGALAFEAATHVRIEPLEPDSPPAPPIGQAPA